MSQLPTREDSVNRTDELAAQAVREARDALVMAWQANETAPHDIAAAGEFINGYLKRRYGVDSITGDTSEKAGGTER